MIKGLWKKYIQGSDERSSLAIKNILLGLSYKAIGITIGFAYFPISIEYLGKANFGVFLVLVSMVDWFSEFDIGIHNGLRNKLGEAVSKDDKLNARSFVSTAYFFLGGIFSGIALIAISISFFIPWSDMLQTPEDQNYEVAWLAVMMFAAIAINFVSSLVYSIFYAHQRSAIVDLFSMVTKVLFLGAIIGLIYMTGSSLIYYGLAKSITLVIVPLAVGIYCFRGIFRDFKPSWKHVSKGHYDMLISLGIQFFLIKISMIIIHQTNNVLISRYVSTEAVTDYEASYKFLSIFLLVFVTLTNQLWAAGVDAFAKEDYEWIRKALKNIIKIWFGTLILAAIMIIISPYVLRFLLRSNEIPTMMISVMVAISIAITNWVNMFNLFINSTGKIKLQMYTWILAATLNIPLSIYFANILELGTIGIILGTIVCMFPLAILAPIQVYKILNKKDLGIWSK